MKNAKIIAIVGVVILLVIFYQVFSRDKDLAEKNIIDNDQYTTQKDNTLSIKPIEHTIDFFKNLQGKFKGISLEDHFKQIEAYLCSVMDPNRAAEIFALYNKFTQYENNLSEGSKKRSPPKSPRERIKHLDDLQEYRRNYFGKELADALFSRQVKSQKYHIRKNTIMEDKDLYGVEKEKRLNQLRQEIWGDEADNIDSGRNPYELYIEKLSMYDKDMGELSDKEKIEKIKSLRKDFFPPDVIELVKKVDERLAIKRKREGEYHQNEQKIKSGPKLTTGEMEERGN